MVGSPGTTLQAELSRLANGGTNYLPYHSAQEAANIWAGTTNLDMIGALNAKATTSKLALNGVCNALAGTSNLDAVTALRTRAT